MFINPNLSPDNNNTRLYIVQILYSDMTQSAPICHIVRSGTNFIHQHRTFVNTVWDYREYLDILKVKSSDPMLKTDYPPECVKSIVPKSINFIILEFKLGEYKQIDELVWQFPDKERMQSESIFIFKYGLNFEGREVTTSTPVDNPTGHMTFNDCSRIFQEHFNNNFDTGPKFHKIILVRGYPPHGNKGISFETFLDWEAEKKGDE